MANPNLQLLTDAAKLLKPILGESVFVGGCATALLITDSAAADVRCLKLQALRSKERFMHWWSALSRAATYVPTLTHSICCGLLSASPM
jgi:hypothetical protein